MSSACEHLEDPDWEAMEGAVLIAGDAADVGAIARVASRLPWDAQGVILIEAAARMKADMVVPMSAAARETTSFSAASIFRSSRAAEAVMVRSFEAAYQGVMGQLVRNFTVWICYPRGIFCCEKSSRKHVLH